MLLSIFLTHLGFMSLESISSFCISSFICWRALLKYSEEWTTDTVSLRWFDVRFKSGCLGIFHFNLKGGLCYVYSRFVGHLHLGTPLLSWTAHPFRLYQMYWLVNSGYKDGYALHLGLSSHPPVGPYYISGASGFSVCTLWLGQMFVDLVLCPIHEDFRQYLPDDF